MKILIFLLSILVPSMSQIIIQNGAINVTSDLCIELNKQRFDLAECCKYPQINYRSFFQGNCATECFGSRDICCSVGCIWRGSNVIDENNQIDTENIKQLLMKTVAHDEHWTDIIRNVVDECMDEFSALEKPVTLCKFPWHIIKVLGCVTRKSFLQCPKMKPIPECKITKQYVSECM
ncbi:hypothetical protein PVAND_014530 [Polypedilum vanderplanki]|uniref:Uncharacterized protein n=1 Tax=Polypedilum vanderplanki TaxID=319348 RepID=A0A9J6B9X3_POLVA|nr:hypothetical protein PVAND_014530 [Polypedilum vanderplanki]